MYTRIWRSKFNRDRRAELERFASEVSAPMSEALDGCLGHIYGVDGSTWITQTFWDSRQSIAAAESTAAYREAVERIVAAGFLAGEQTTEVFEVVGDSVTVLGGSWIETEEGNENG